MSCVSAASKMRRRASSALRRVRGARLLGNPALFATALRSSVALRAAARLAVAIRTFTARPL
jgi:hypothetical protein